jgi:hypothetical protein
MSLSSYATPVALTGSNQAVSATPAAYRGFTIRETAGAVAVVRIWDNASAASGVVLEEISLAANESARELYLPGVWAANGVFVQVVSGTVVGSVRIG